jgi:hypothetical protein
MTLIIRDLLVNPPTWFLSFRDLTLYCHVFLKSDIVIESDEPDIYYRWIKPRGGMDFVEDFVRPAPKTGCGSTWNITIPAPSSPTGSLPKMSTG